MGLGNEDGQQVWGIGHKGHIYTAAFFDGLQDAGVSHVTRPEQIHSIILQPQDMFTSHS